MYQCDPVRTSSDLRFARSGENLIFRMTVGKRMFDVRVRLPLPAAPERITGLCPGLQMFKRFENYYTSRSGSPTTTRVTSIH